MGALSLCPKGDFEWPTQEARQDQRGSGEEEARRIRQKERKAQKDAEYDAMLRGMCKGWEPFGGVLPPFKHGAKASDYQYERELLDSFLESGDGIWYRDFGGYDGARYPKYRLRYVAREAGYPVRVVMADGMVFIINEAGD